MPRPPVKRSRLNPQHHANKRAPNSSLSSSPAARRRQLELQLAHKNVGQVPNESDDSDLLVTKTKNFRNRRGVPRQEIYGSGGVAEGDQIAAHKSPSNTRLRRSSKEESTPEALLNTGHKKAPLHSKGLRPIDRLSVSRTARPSTSRAPASAGPSPLAVKPSTVSGITHQETPAAETSILGPIRIRKRQPSILQSIASPESSILDQDLEDFLPEDESTPLNAPRKRKLSSPPARSPTALPARSQSQQDDVEAAGENTFSTEPALPPVPLTEISKHRQRLPEIDSDTMAPPRSSSSGTDPVQVKTPSTTKNKANIGKGREPRSLSTAALQALMPARRQPRSRLDRAAKAISGFDIPEDSSDAPNNTSDRRTAKSSAEESYVASPRPAKRTGKERPQAAKLQRRKTRPVRKASTKHPATEEEKGGRGGSRVGHGKRASSTQPSSPSIITRATPSAAKTSSPQQQQQHQQGHRHHLKSVDGPVRTYSRRAGLGSSSAGAEEDKENRPSTLSGASSKQGRVRRPSGNRGGPLSRRLDERGDDDDIGFRFGFGSAGAGRGGGNDEDTELTIFPDPEQARLVRKFKEVDEWEMEFEDVTSDSGASDPLAR